MNKEFIMKYFILALAILVLTTGCIESKKTQSAKTALTVEKQQAQYAKA